MNKKAQSGQFAVVILLVLFFLGLITLILGFDMVDASHIGVKNQFGTLKGTMSAGMQWTGLFTHVESYDLRMRRMVVEMQADNSAVDKDGQSVYATIEINYRLIPDNIENAYSKIGTDAKLAEILNVEGRIKEGFKTVTSQYSSLEIFQKREEVKLKSIEQIEANFPKEYFILENVILSNIDFNPAFKSAIEQKKVAEEMAKAREKEVDVSKFEADKKIQDARGVAESTKLSADAQAYTIKVQAEAEAEALRLKKEQLTPQMVQNNWIDKWNGQLPMYMFGGNSNILFSVPNLGNETVK